MGAVFPNILYLCFVAHEDMYVCVIQTSFLHWFLGDVSFTFFPSRKSRKTFEYINSLLHLKSCETIKSAWYAPTQTYLPFAEFINARKMIRSGFNRNVLHNLEDEMSYFGFCLFHVLANSLWYQKKHKGLCYSAGALA